MTAATPDVTKRGTGAAAHLGIDLAEYDGRIRTFIPEYDTLLRQAGAALATAARRRRPVVVDLGIGTGALSAAVLHAVAGARIVAVDEDENMIRAARARLGAALTRACHGSFETCELPRCDAAVASLALHHIPTPARRLRLFRRIHRALAPGGVLVSADCYPESNRRLAAAGRAAWLAHLEKSYTPTESRAYLRAWAHEDRYALLIDEVTTLQRAGFEVDVAYRRGTWAVIVATRRLQ